MGVSTRVIESERYAIIEPEKEKESKRQHSIHIHPPSGSIGHTLSVHIPSWQQATSDQLRSMCW